MTEARMLSSTCHANFGGVLPENRYGVIDFSKRSAIYLSGVSYPSLKSSASSSELFGHKVAMFGVGGGPTGGGAASNAMMGIGLKMKGQKWWEKGVQPNMKEISGAQDLVDSLKNAGDKLVVVDFFSPGCGGCKALHPKISQLAEMNPDVQFLQVNHEEHKSMCYSLNVHVLPFFRFYRGVDGRVCSFSCTNATIKKFKDALAKYGPDRCSLGPTKGLEEKELVALSANRDLSFNYAPEQEELMPLPAKEETLEEATPLFAPLPLPSTKAAHKSGEKSPIYAGR